MERQPTAAFILTLLAGLWMLGAGGMMYGMGAGFMDGASGMWGQGMMRMLGPGLWFPWFGPIAGVVLLVGAFMLYARPEQAQRWGVVVIVTAAVNLFVGMGGILAAGLGIIGGALAMSWKPASER